MARPARPLFSRFWEKVAIDDSSKCWEWTGMLHKNGYGKFTAKYSDRAHRIAWLLTFGQVQDGLVICHKCDNRLCVNPEHLFAGTQGDNALDMVRKGRQPKGEKHGTHKLTEVEVVEIRTTLGSQRSIAKQYGVSQSMVHYIKARKSWNH